LEKSKKTWTARKPESALSTILGLFPNKTKKKKRKEIEKLRDNRKRCEFPQPFQVTLSLHKRFPVECL